MEKPAPHLFFARENGPRLWILAPPRKSASRGENCEDIPPDRLSGILCAGSPPGTSRKSGLHAPQLPQSCEHRGPVLRPDDPGGQPVAELQIHPGTSVNHRNRRAPEPASLPDHMGADFLFPRSADAAPEPQHGPGRFHGHGPVSLPFPAAGASTTRSGSLACPGATGAHDTVSAHGRSGALGTGPPDVDAGHGPERFVNGWGVYRLGFPRGRSAGKRRTRGPER